MKTELHQTTVLNEQLASEINPNKKPLPQGSGFLFGINNFTVRQLGYLR